MKTKFDPKLSIYSMKKGTIKLEIFKSRQPHQKILNNNIIFLIINTLAHFYSNFLIYIDCTT